MNKREELNLVPSSSFANRKNTNIKQRADIREIAFEVLTANANRQWIKDQIQNITDPEELKEILMTLVDHYHEQIKKSGAIIVELLNKEEL